MAALTFARLAPTRAATLLSVHARRDVSSSQGTGYEKVLLTLPPSHPEKCPSPPAAQPAAHAAELGQELAAAEIVTELTPRRPSVSLVTADGAAPPVDPGAPGLKGSARLAALTAALDKAPGSGFSKGSAPSVGTPTGGGLVSAAATSSAAAAADSRLLQHQQPESEQQQSSQARQQEQEQHQCEAQRRAEQAEDATGVAAGLNVTLVPNGLLGKGSFGRVYRGRYQGREVAVKVRAARSVMGVFGGVQEERRAHLQLPVLNCVR